jgi:hypothetical protein
MCRKEIRSPKNLLATAVQSSAGSSNQLETHIQQLHLTKSAQTLSTNTQTLSTDKYIVCALLDPGVKSQTADDTGAQLQA